MGTVPHIPHWTLQDIAEATNIPPEDLKRSLQSLALVKGKNILRKEPLSRCVAESNHPDVCGSSI